MALMADFLECVKITEDSLTKWSAFCKKYADANFILDIEEHRHRLMSMLKIFHEVSTKVDKILCPAENVLNLPSRSAEAEGTPADPAQPVLSLPKGADGSGTMPINFNFNSQDMDASKLYDYDILNDPVITSDFIAKILENDVPVSQTYHIPVADVTGHQLEIASSPKSSNPSPVLFQNQQRHFDSQKLKGKATKVCKKLFEGKGRSVPSEKEANSTVSASASDLLVELIDLTEDNSPLLLEIENVHTVTKSESIETANIWDNLSLAEQLQLSEDSSSDCHSPNQSPEAVKATANSSRCIRIGPRSKNGQDQTAASDFFKPSQTISSSSSTSSGSLFISPRKESMGKQISYGKKKMLSKWEKEKHCAKNSEKRIHLFQCHCCKETFPNLKLHKDHMKVHENPIKTFCRGCGLYFSKRSGADSHYDHCPIYKHESLDGRLEGMRLVLEKPEGELLEHYDLGHLKRQRKLLEENNEIDIPAIPPCIRTSQRTERFSQSPNHV